MTVEEWIAQKAGHPSIQNLRFEANPGRRWSEYTEERFDATVRFTVHGEERVLYLGESDVCDMLNDCFPVT